MTAVATSATTMTKRRTSGPGRGQEEFTGDFADALGAIQRERERRARARRRPTGGQPGPSPGPPGPVRPFAVGWRLVEYSYETDRTETVAMGRCVMLGRSADTVAARAPRWCLRDAQRRYHGPEGFEIRYIKELK